MRMLTMLSYFSEYGKTLILTFCVCLFFSFFATQLKCMHIPLCCCNKVCDKQCTIKSPTSCHVRECYYSRHEKCYSSNKKTNITPFWANVILWEFCSIVLLFLLLILRNLTQWLNPCIFELTKSWGSSWYDFHSGNSISWKIENFSSSFSADQIFIFTSKIGLKSSALCSETNPTERTTIPLKLTKIWRILQSGSQLLT